MRAAAPQRCAVRPGDGAKFAVADAPPVPPGAVPAGCGVSVAPHRAGTAPGLRPPRTSGAAGVRLQRRSPPPPPPPPSRVLRRSPGRFAVNRGFRGGSAVPGAGGGRGAGGAAALPASPICMRMGADPGRCPASSIHPEECEETRSLQCDNGPSESGIKAQCERGRGSAALLPRPRLCARGAAGPAWAERRAARDAPPAPSAAHLPFAGALSGLCCPKGAGRSAGQRRLFTPAPGVPAPALADKGTGPAAAPLSPLSKGPLSAGPAPVPCERRDGSEAHCAGGSALPGPHNRCSPAIFALPQVILSPGAGSGRISHHFRRWRGR
ncbi:collagen alpha-1(III) chain-like [Motacilla alba alba]|uniref:collagen alpha-1(III) chain-like n=1 Tax=Motacilla alba alba TaxID=1094192 RepID=UPI0018D54E39|nr:collagen alpha-1(III) chain-like [Motacilla alba alba]